MQSLSVRRIAKNCLATLCSYGLPSEVSPWPKHGLKNTSMLHIPSRVKRTAVLRGIPHNCGDFTQFCAAVLRDFAPGNATIAPKTAHERAYNRAKPSVAFALKVTPSISIDNIP